MPSNHLILCHPLLLLLSIFPSIRVFSNESVPCNDWPKYWNFHFSISPSKEYSGLISFRMDWLDLLTVQGTLESLLQYHSSKDSILWQRICQRIEAKDMRKVLRLKTHAVFKPHGAIWSLLLSASSYQQVSIRVTWRACETQLAGRVLSSKKPRLEPVGARWTFIALWATPEKNTDLERNNWSASDRGRQTAWEGHDTDHLRVLSLCLTDKTSHPPRKCTPDQYVQIALCLQAVSKLKIRNIHPLTFICPWVIYQSGSFQLALSWLESWVAQRRISHLIT